MMTMIGTNVKMTMASCKKMMTIGSVTMMKIMVKKQEKKG